MIAPRKDTVEGVGAGGAVAAGKIGGNDGVVAPADVDAALPKPQSDAERGADMICRLQEVCLPGDASNYKAAAKIALRKTKWKKTNDQLREIAILLDYRIDATAEQIGAALEPPVKRQTVSRTKFWSNLIVERKRDKEDTKHGELAANAHQPRRNGKTMSALTTR